jgi:hypothetical protein
MSFTPWKEAAFLLNSTKSSGSAVTSNTATLSPDKNSDKNSKNSTAERNSMTLSVRKKSKENNVDLEAFDKRFILRTMQKQCSVEFLRNHNLAGSEELILKKKNKASILLAYTEWIGEKGTDDGEVVGANADGSDNGSGGGDAMNQICIDQSVSYSDNSDVSGKRLTDTFSVLYSRSGCTRTTVLLLHEDYSNELPVFGKQQNTTDTLNNPSNNSSISTTDKLLKKGNLGADVAGRDGKGGSESHRIICVMGAVRDASDSEVSLAIAGECGAS